jgi:hypothetical protein
MAFWLKYERKLTLCGQGALFLRVCTPKWKTIFPVGNLLSSADHFSAHLLLREPEKATKMGISRDLRIGRGLAITQSHQDIERDRQGVSA